MLLTLCSRGVIPNSSCRSLRSLHVSLWLHLICIEVLMDVHDALSHGRLELVHERVRHHRVLRVAAWVLWRRVVGSGAGWHIIFLDWLLRAIIHHVGHLDTCLVAEVAHIAISAEGKVVVAAPFADPVTSSLVRILFLFFCS